MKNVSKKIDCTGCGSCVIVCPQNAIKMIINKFGFYIPFVELSKCDNCGLCLKVCPDMHITNLSSNNLKSYICSSKDESIRFNSSSGGFVTQLLINLLDEKKIDGAIVTSEYKDESMPNAFIAYSKGDLLKAKGSKYTPVPLNLIFNELRCLNGKFAVVGLPCHLKGIDNIARYDSNFRDKIILKIGLICNHTPSLHATKYLCWINKLDYNDLKEVVFRHKGWPGKAELKTSMKTKETELMQYWSSGFGGSFFNDACLSCKDVYVDNADVFASDPWNISDCQSEMGNTLIGLRNYQWKDYIQSLNNMNIKEIPLDTFEKSLISLKKGKLKEKSMFIRFIKKLGQNKIEWFLIYFIYNWKIIIKRTIKNIFFNKVIFK